MIIQNPNPNPKEFPIQAPPMSLAGRITCCYGDPSPTHSKKRDELSVIQSAEGQKEPSSHQ